MKVALLLATAVAFADIRYFPSLTADEVKSAAPTDLTVASRVVSVLEKPGAGATVGSINAGEKLRVEGFATGPERRRNCQATPFNGCIESSTAWVSIRLPNGKSGYAALVDFHAPSLKRDSTGLRLETLFAYQRTESPVKMFDAPVAGWELPTPSNPSWLDRVGWQNVIAKAVTPARELIASRREIEYIARSSGVRFAYTGKATRVPAHWTDFPALIQSMSAEPGLAALSVTEKSVERRSIASLSAARFFTFYPKMKGESVPLSYPLAPALGKPLALVFLTGRASQEFDSSKVRVASTRIKNAYRTGVDFDADGQPEIIVLRSFPGAPDCNPQTDECGSPASVIVCLHQGAWYMTADVKRGQDGWLGF